MAGINSHLHGPSSGMIRTNDASMGTRPVSKSKNPKRKRTTLLLPVTASSGRFRRRSNMRVTSTWYSSFSRESASSGRCWSLSWENENRLVAPRTAKIDNDDAAPAADEAFNTPASCVVWKAKGLFVGKRTLDDTKNAQLVCRHVAITNTVRKIVSVLLCDSRIPMVKKKGL
jgi:hypothetical protein